MIVYVDADACPVKSILIEEATFFQVKCIFVCSYASHFHLEGPWIETRVMDKGFQSVDMYIANQVKSRDLIVTDDYGLACIVLAKRCLAISSRGKEYTNDNINQLLMSRHYSAKERMSGQRMKGLKPMSKGEEEQFKILLKKCFSNGQDFVEF